jgi:hypothetical protein
LVGGETLMINALALNAVRKTRAILTPRDMLPTSRFHPCNGTIVLNQRGERVLERIDNRDRNQHVHHTSDEALPSRHRP